MSEIVDSLEKLLIFLDVHVEFVDCFTIEFVELILAAICCGVGFGRFGTFFLDICCIFLLFLFQLLLDKLLGCFLFHFFYEPVHSFILLVRRYDIFVWGLGFLFTFLGIVHFLHLFKPQHFFTLFFDPFFFELFFYQALFAKKGILGNLFQRRVKTVHMESFITLITDDKLYIIVIISIATDKTDHIFKPVIPLTSSQISWPET